VIFDLLFCADKGNRSRWDAAKEAEDFLAVFVLCKTPDLQCRILYQTDVYTIFV